MRSETTSCLRQGHQHIYYSLLLYQNISLLSGKNLFELIVMINPWCASAARVTVVILCVCVCVSVGYHSSGGIAHFILQPFLSFQLVNVQKNLLFRSCGIILVLLHVHMYLISLKRRYAQLLYRPFLLHVPSLSATRVFVFRLAMFLPLHVHFISVCVFPVCCMYYFSDWLYLFYT